jgi:hypothetical protein
MPVPVPHDDPEAVHTRPADGGDLDTPCLAESGRAGTSTTADPAEVSCAHCLTIADRERSGPGAAERAYRAGR